jgi:hypothetical protein
MKDQPGVIFHMLKKRHNIRGRIFRYGGLFLIYFIFGEAAGQGGGRGLIILILRAGLTPGPHREVR